MNESEAALAVTTWLSDVVAADGGLTDFAATYEVPMAAIDALPFVAAYPTARQVRPTDDRFPLFDVQGHWLRVFPMEISIMVALSNDPENVGDQQGQLYGYGQALSDSLLSDPTLAGELPANAMASPQHDVDYSEPFIEYDDGTRGRVLVAEIAVAEIIDGPE